MIIDLIPGFSLFLGGLGVLQLILGGLRYVVSDGDLRAVTIAKNTILYSIVEVTAGILLYPIFLIFGNSAGLIEYIVGFGLAAVPILGGLLLLKGIYVSAAVAAYSAWWMPESERAAHYQDIRYALRHAHGTRSRHAWRTLKASPRAGLRARRHHTHLALIMADTEITRAATWATLDGAPKQKG
ncbi:hypothetical protein ACFUTV_41240 [Streptomyces sp. NPDC057298]|uniref:hypothetical protein n=1 Tax=Streptomyces sp. NPDC057298 TaxID=3346091 RepID=UPI003641BFAB